MEETKDLPEIPEEDTAYTPRPAYQVWIARIGLILFLGLLAFYYFGLFGGGA